MIFTIRASKDGQTIETVREGPTATVAKARGLFKTGWLVQIIDSDGLTYAPSEFDELLGFDRHKKSKAKRDFKRRRSEHRGEYPGGAARTVVAGASEAAEPAAGAERYVLRVPLMQKPAQASA